MGIDVVVHDEKGAQLQIVSDEKNLIAALLGSPTFSRSPMTASIDRYGDTIFNRVQIEQFLIEWSEVSQRAPTIDEQRITADIKKLAENVRDSVHLYLAFVGD